MIEEADSFSAEEESEGVAFIVDTGATATLLSLQAAERLAAQGRVLNVRPEAKRFRTASGHIITSSSEATFSLDEIAPGFEAKAYVVEMRVPNLIGQDVIRRTTFTVSKAVGKLGLADLETARNEHFLLTLRYKGTGLTSNMPEVEAETEVSVPRINTTHDDSDSDCSEPPVLCDTESDFEPVLKNGNRTEHFRIDTSESETETPNIWLKPEHYFNTFSFPSPQHGSWRLRSRKERVWTPKTSKDAGEQDQGLVRTHDRLSDPRHT
jgi:hypothetical protein